MDDQFASANKAYEQGKFADAAALYEMAITNGAATASAWFNLGNARFKSGELGRAIAAWQRAERLEPRDAAIRANLAFGRRKAAGGVDRDAPPASALLGFFTPNEWAAAASLTLLALFAILAIEEWRNRGRSPRGTLTVLAIAGVLLWAAAAKSFVETYRRVEAVAIRQAAARMGPLEDSQIAFQVNDGAEFTVRDESSGWVQISSHDGKIGWLKKSDVALIGPPK